jgi:arginyl-tRNA synthetase
MLIEILAKVLTETFNTLKYPDVNLKIIKSNRLDLCDYQFNGVFKLASALKLAPDVIGLNIVEKLKQRPDYTSLFKDVTFVKPGFINFTLADALINKIISNMANSPKFGINAQENHKIIVDYGGYNIAKPLHIGHLRPSIIGESIKRICAYYGNTVIGDVHLGDYGLQIGEVIYGIIRDNKVIADIDIEYLNKIYPEISALCKANPEINDECAEITKKLQEGNQTYSAYWQKIMAVSLADIKKLCNYLDVNFELWEGESDAFKYLPTVEQILKEQNLLVISDGAAVVNVKKANDNKPMPPFIFKKSNGAYLYDSTDLATIYERKTKFNPDKIIYVTDFRQRLHFEQVFRVSDLAGFIPYNNLEHAYNGTINGLDGKPFKTRQGDAPKLVELIAMVKDTFLSLKATNKDMNPHDIDIIVNAIIKFADLQNCRDKDYIFDINKFSDVVGKTGPYLLYTYVRVQKILTNYPNLPTKLSTNIYNVDDRNLRMALLELPDYLYEAYTTRMPSYLANYLYDLCVLLNTFYQANHIIGLENQEKLNDWLYVLNLTNKIIKEMLKLLLIDVPSAM